jgi:hypothetical protein
MRDRQESHRSSSSTGQFLDLLRVDFPIEPAPTYERLVQTASTACHPPPRGPASHGAGPT